MPHVFDCAGYALDLSTPRVMGVLNVTPDSFSDGGRYLDCDAAVGHARDMATKGAVVIDVGGESTRPGAASVSVQEELDRVIPVIERLRAEVPVAISIDTSKPEVMQAAVSAGAGFINDVRALRAPGALGAAARAGVPVCLVHMLSEPRTMQAAPHYDDVVGEVKAFLAQRIDACVRAGIAREQILIDPGIGFGKTVEHNLTLIRHLERFNELRTPILIGVSRKSTIGALLDAPVDQRLTGSIVLAALAVWNGAALVRAHDVRETVQALHILRALRAVP